MSKKSSLNESQQYAIKFLIATKKDSEISNILGIKLNSVKYYRRHVLDIKKYSGRPVMINENNVSITEVSEEIKAMQNFANYPSFMNGAKDRVKLLISLVEGIRC